MNNRARKKYKRWKDTEMIHERKSIRKEKLLETELKKLIEDYEKNSSRDLTKADRVL